MKRISLFLALIFAFYAAGIWPGGAAGAHTVFAEESSEEKGVIPSLPVLGASSAVEFFVATDGDDSDEGTIEKPFATLERARDAIRALKKTQGLPKGGVTVNIRAGNYYFINNSFLLEKEDSGAPESPVVYRGYMDERVQLLGGYNLDITKVRPVEDRSIIDRLPTADAKKRVVQIDLKQQGIVDFVPVMRNGYGIHNPFPRQIYCNDKVLHLSRYPNKSLPAGQDFTFVGQVVEQGKDKELTFRYTDNNVGRWKQENGIMIFIYPIYDWWEDSFPVKLDKINKTITSVGAPGVETETNKRFYYFNVLDEIDEAGEYYLDDDKGILYFYPPTDAKITTLQMAASDQPVVRLNHASNITLSKLTVALGSENGININGGENNLIAYCTVKGIAYVGISNVQEDVEDWHDLLYHPYEDMPLASKNLGIVGCEIYNIGHSAVRTNAGNRNTLEPGGNYFLNNVVHDFSQLKKTYSAGFALFGSGNRCAYNKIYNAPHFGIEFRSAETIIEFNELYNLCLETDDTSAIYAGREFSCPGNTVRYNYIHDVMGIPTSTIGAFGIYLDDQFTGCELYANVIERCMQAMHIGGGKWNTVKNNVIIDCPRSIAYDDRGMQRTRVNYIEEWGMLPRLEDAGPWKPIWLERYPNINPLLEEDSNLSIPEGAIIENNIFYETAGLNLADGVYQYGSVKNNLFFNRNPGFVDMAGKDFRLKSDSQVFEQLPGFKNIPMGRIGPFGGYALGRIKEAVVFRTGTPRMMVNNVITSVDRQRPAAVPYVSGGEVMIPAKGAQTAGADTLEDISLTQLANSLGKQMFYDEQTGLAILADRGGIFNKQTERDLLDEIVRQITIR